MSSTFSETNIYQEGEVEMKMDLHSYYKIRTRDKKFSLEIKMAASPISFAAMQRKIIFNSFQSYFKVFTTQSEQKYFIFPQKKEICLWRELAQNNKRWHSHMAQEVNTTSHIFLNLQRVPSDKRNILRILVPFLVRLVVDLQKKKLAKSIRQWKGATQWVKWFKIEKRIQIQEI